MSRWPQHKAYFWETAPFFKVILPFALGIYYYDASFNNAINPSKLNAFLLIACIALIVGSCTCLLLNRIAQKFSAFAFPVLFNIGFFVIGVTTSYFHDIRNDNQWFGKNQGALTIARITAQPLEKENSWKVIVSAVSQVSKEKKEPASGDAFLYIAKDAPNHSIAINKGDTIIIPNNWQPIKNNGNPYEFDYKKYCARNNIMFTQFCPQNSPHLYGKANPANAPILEQAHDWCMVQLDKYLADTIAKGLVQAMLIGDETNLDGNLRQQWADTGIVHIIAISGGNVAIFYLVIAWLLKWVIKPKHVWVKYIVAMPLVWFYVLMAGGSPSAVRAGLMFTFWAFSILLQKNNNSLNQLCSASVLLLCCQPMWLFSTGFQLSFVAVLSILLFYGKINSWFKPKYKFIKWAWEAVAASLAAEILVAPMVVFYFHNFPVFFIVANVVAFFFMFVVQVASMAIVALFFMPYVPALLGIVTCKLVLWFNKFIEVLQHLGPKQFRFLQFNLLETILLYLAIAFFAYSLVTKYKRGMFLGLACSIALLLFCCTDQWESLNQQKLVIYNTGKCNQIEMYTGNHFTVIQKSGAKPKSTDFAVLPAHTRWQAWQSNGQDTNRELITIGGKTLLLLKEPIFSELQFPVDYLYLDYNGIVDVNALMRSYFPKEIIAGNCVPRRQIQKIKTKAKNANVKVYDLAQQGAFVLSGSTFGTQ